MPRIVIVIFLTLWLVYAELVINLFKFRQTYSRYDIKIMYNFTADLINFGQHLSSSPLYPSMSAKVKLSMFKTKKNG
jgi:hypothetical protein